MYYGIANHIFSDRAASQSVSAKDGWVRMDETRVTPHRREWKFGQRDNKPEEEAFSLDKLERRFKAQLHAGSMPRRSQRRLPVAIRAAKIIKLKEKMRLKSQRITAACKALRAEAG